MRVPIAHTLPKEEVRRRLRERLEPVLDEFTTEDAHEAD